MTRAMHRCLQCDVQKSLHHVSDPQPTALLGGADTTSHATACRPTRLGSKRRCRRARHLSSAATAEAAAAARSTKACRLMEPLKFRHRLPTRCIVGQYAAQQKQESAQGLMMHTRAPCTSAAAGTCARSESHPRLASAPAVQTLLRHMRAPGKLQQQQKYSES